MAPFPFAPRRVVFAGGLALALTVAPTVAVLAYPTAQPALLADSTSDGCTSGESLDAYSLACVPDIVPSIGAPSEQQLTDENPGIAAPGSHGGR
ncbi:MAG: hypothetical protein JO152_03965 [Mycobacteriaceae bacterium]|nr:hypothetical protein [Mycobacteriaceae bacterium]